MTLRPRWLNGQLSYYDSVTDETILPVAPVSFYEDFLGKAIDTVTAWTALDVSAAGLTTPVLVADAPNGVVSLPLDATNEVQLAGLYWGDQRTLVLNQKLVFEARVRLSVLPTGAVIAVIGLAGDHNAAVNAVAESIWFRLDGSGVITVETDDTVHETSLVASGVTVIAGQWVTLRIECDDPSAIRFFIDGVRVAAATVFNMSQVAALALQPIVRIGKEGAAVTVGTMQVDYVRTWQKRS